jgi:hypothetical protein
VLGGRERVDAVRLARAALCAPGTFHLDDGMPGALKVLAQTGAPAAGSLDAERKPIRVAVALGPLLKLGVSGGVRREAQVAQDLAEPVDGHRIVALLVGVDPDCDHRCLLAI